MKQGIIYRVAEGPFRYQAWPTVCRDEAGTLYVACSGHRVSHVCPFGKNLLLISRDNGTTWTPPMIVNDTWLDDRDAGLCYLGNGKILMTYFNHPAEFYYRDRLQSVVKRTEPFTHEMTMGLVNQLHTLTPEQNRYGSFVRVSPDGGVSWGDAIKVPVTAPHGPIKTHSGKLLYLGKEFHSDLEHTGWIHLMESDDDGQTWQVRSVLECPEGIPAAKLSEPHLAQLPDGTLFGAIRGENVPADGHMTMFFTRSEDGGLTWSRPTPSGICGAPPHFLVLSDGRLLCTFSRREDPCGIRAIISCDGGKTFGDEITLFSSPSSDLGYPSTVELDDHTLLTVYYGRVGDDNRTSILYTKWSI